MGHIEIEKFQKGQILQRESEELDESPMAHFLRSADDEAYVSRLREAYEKDVKHPWE